MTKQRPESAFRGANFGVAVAPPSMHAWEGDFVNEDTTEREKEGEECKATFQAEAGEATTIKACTEAQISPRRLTMSNNRGLKRCVDVITRPHSAQIRTRTRPNSA